jgi:hypothetical protein
MDVDSSRLSYDDLELIEAKLKAIESELADNVSRLDDFNDDYW